MVDRIISYQIAHVPPYLGIRVILNFLDMIIFFTVIFLYEPLNGRACKKNIEMVNSETMMPVYVKSRSRNERREQLDSSM